MKQFKSELLSSCGYCGEGLGLEAALNHRQKDLAASAKHALEHCLDAAANGLPWDFWTIDLRDAISQLGEITGAEISEAVLDRVFSKFCIGK